MRKKIIYTTSLFCSILLLTISASCNQPSNNKNKSLLVAGEINDEPVSSGQQWLKSIFDCNNETGFCFPDEEKVTTERYYEYFIETIGIYEYPMFDSEVERVAAEKVYKNKWKDIYRLDVEMSSPFGRGNGIGYGDPLKDVIITSQSETEHTVLINYGGVMTTKTNVTLIPNGNSYLIDYMKTEYIE